MVKTRLPHFLFYQSGSRALGGGDSETLISTVGILVLVVERPYVLGSRDYDRVLRPSDFDGRAVVVPNSVSDVDGTGCPTT